MRRCEAPAALAASMYVCSLTLRVALRITREPSAATRMPRATMRLVMLRPTMAMMLTNSTSHGKAIQASTTRCISKSKVPPK